MRKTLFLALAFVCIATLAFACVPSRLYGQVTSADPQTRYRDTDYLTDLAHGLWRIRFNGDAWSIEKNTAAAGDFSTTIIPISATGSGVLVLNNGSTQGALMAASTKTLPNNTSTPLFTLVIPTSPVGPTGYSSAGAAVDYMITVNDQQVETGYVLVATYMDGMLLTHPSVQRIASRQSVSTGTLNISFSAADSGSSSSIVSVTSNSSLGGAYTQLIFYTVRALTGNSLTIN